MCTQVGFPVYFVFFFSTSTQYLPPGSAIRIFVHFFRIDFGVYRISFVPTVSRVPADSNYLRSASKKEQPKTWKDIGRKTKRCPTIYLSRNLCALRDTVFELENVSKKIIIYCQTRYEILKPCFLNSARFSPTIIRMATTGRVCLL